MRRLVRNLVDVFPLTLGGLVLFLLSALGLLHWGLGQTDLLLLAIGGLGLLVATVAFLAVVCTAATVFFALRGKVGDRALELECGYPGDTGFSVSNLWFLPFVSVSWTWEQPEVQLEVVERWGRLHERVTPTRRGEVQEVVRRIEVADSLGVARVAFPVREERTCRFVPTTGRLENIHVVQGMAGGEHIAHSDGTPTGDRFDMKRYGAGDPIRFVLWKVFAKSRVLVVRKPERAISPVQQTVAYLVTGEGDQAAAGTARVAVKGALGSDWMLGADGSTEGTRHAGQALDLIVRSADTPKTAGGGQLSAFLHGSSNLRRALVFVPPIPGPWLDKVEAAARDHSDKRLEVVICTDGIGDTRSGLVSKAMFRGKAQLGPTPTPPELLGAVIRRLSRCADRVLVVDRQAGQVYPESHLAHLVRNAS
jgi:hypothetical protein